VDEILDLDVGGFHALFSATAALPRDVATRLGEFDLAVNMLASRSGTVDVPDGGGPANAADPSTAMRTRLQESGIRKVIDIDPRPRPDWRGHITDQWLADLRAGGVDGAAGSPRVQLSPSVLDPARRRLEAVTGRAADRVVIVHPGSGGLRKCWPVSSFVALTVQLRARDRPVVLMLGPVERERFQDADLRRLRDSAPVIEDCSLREAAAVLAVAGRFIGNDSGMTHVAAALGVRTVAIFGPTERRLWRPLGDHVVVPSIAAGGAWPSVHDAVRSLQLDGDVDSAHSG
jgi:hypothetical protein